MLELLRSFYICWLEGSASPGFFLSPFRTCTMAAAHDHMECPSDEDEAFYWLAGVWEEWESIKMLRQRSREGPCIMSGLRRALDNAEVVAGTLKCACLNHQILKMVTARMANSGITASPPLGRLYPEFLGFHQQHSNLNLADMQTVAHADACGMNRLITFMKRKWSRSEMPSDTLLILHIARCACAFIVCGAFGGSVCVCVHVC